MSTPTIDDDLANEAEELDGYFSDAPLEPEPRYPPLDTSLTTAVILTNLPRVPQSKLDKLIKVVTKTVSRIGPLAVRATTTSEEADDDAAFDGVYMPFDDAAGTTAGVCLVEYETAEHAATAVEVLQNYKFDKSHTLTVTLLERAKTLQDVSVAAAFTAPAPEPFAEPPRAVAWMEDPSQRDQYVVRFATETVVNWWDPKAAAPALDYDGAREKDAGVLWCEYYCHWSPQGTYLATLVPARGVILWSGADYQKVGRFVATGVKQILFSPMETYLLTNNMDARDPAAIKVYEIRSGRLLRAFPLFPDKMTAAAAAGDEGPPPPAFSWSYNDQYLARQGPDLISIFETPGMRLLDQRSLAAPGICDFQWSPSDNIIAYWVSVVCHVSIVVVGLTVGWCSHTT